MRTFQSLTHDFRSCPFGFALFHNKVELYSRHCRWWAQVITKVATQVTCAAQWAQNGSEFPPFGWWKFDSWLSNKNDGADVSFVLLSHIFKGALDMFRKCDAPGCGTTVKHTWAFASFYLSFLKCIVSIFTPELAKITPSQTLVITPFSPLMVKPVND